ncbi:MAG: hypothetical protein JKY52_18835, partial [Flavobacteriales bacterium]|nr:hypothetical protein [Flavobacteriales bacterium]
ANKTVKKKKTFKYTIHHNLATQSSHDKSIFTTPDISVIVKGKVKNSTVYYRTKRTFSYVENQHLMTFCEVKQFNPFPELLFNFIGILNEIKLEYMSDDGVEHSPPHIAPSLMISGIANRQTTRIKDSLEARYCVNIIYDLFHTGIFTFSKGNLSSIRTAGKLPRLS